MPHTTRLVSALLAVATLTGTCSAGAQIKQPGSHPHYSVEIEPHAILQWAQGPDWHHDDVGPGLGFRASIPFFHNGPIRKINNNMGITFGIDTAFYDGCDRHWRPHQRDWWAEDCSGMDFTFPVAMQWNFWLTPVISVFGEPGLSVSTERGSFEAPCAVEPDGVCEAHDSHVDVEPAFWGGGRFLLGDSVGILVRLGTPYLSVGVGILL
jgi:hypothetical protein